MGVRDEGDDECGVFREIRDKRRTVPAAQRSLGQACA